MDYARIDTLWKEFFKMNNIPGSTGVDHEDDYMHGAYDLMMFLGIKALEDREADKPNERRIYVDGKEVRGE